MTFDSDNDNDEKKEETPARRRRRPARRRVPAQIQDEQMDASEDVTPELQEIPSTMPLLPLRDVVVFNYMIVPLFVGREQSVQAVEAAATHGRHIFLCAQKDGQVDNPKADDLYPVGSVALILRLLKMPDGRIKALVQGVSRARLVDLIDASVRDGISLDDLAASVGLSAWHFSRRFKADFGLSPHAYLIRRRIDRARLLLGRRGQPLKAIAQDCGFADQSHFCRTFRRIVGVTPARFRDLA